MHVSMYVSMYVSYLSETAGRIWLIFGGGGEVIDKTPVGDLRYISWPSQPNFLS